MKIRTLNNVINLVTYFIIIFIAIITVFPIIWLYCGAFKPLTEIFAYPPTFIPRNFTVNNFILLFNEFAFHKNIFNTFIVAISVSLAAILVHSMAAYSISRLNIPGKNLIFILFLGTMLIPTYGVLIPRYLITNSFNWVDTYWGLIIPAIPHAFGIFVLRQFFKTIPTEIEEAAMIDGATKIRIFFSIILPLSKGIIITLVILFFVFCWDDFYWPMVITNSENMRVAQVALANLKGGMATRWDLILAGSVVTLTPSFIIFFVFQRYIVKGVQLTGTKE